MRGASHGKNLASFLARLDRVGHKHRVLFDVFHGFCAGMRVGVVLLRTAQEHPIGP